MQYPEVIKTALDYIELNLKIDITAEELAQKANYSTYHYYRLFSSVIGSSVAAYIMDETKVSGSVWAVGSDYILKTGDREKLLKNLRVSKALHKQGFISSMPVPTKTGSEYLDGKDLFILSHGLKGKPLPKSDRFGENRVSFGENYGRSIARLHKALKTIQKDVLPDEVNLYQSVIDWALPNVRQQNVQWNMGLDNSFFEDYIEGFGKLYDKLPKQLIHRDPNPNNILFENGKVSGFIDFDLSEVNVRLWDVCYCATGILSESSNELYEKWFDILGGILHGYDAENKLSTEEKQTIFYVICSIQMICAAFFESRDEFKELAKTNRRMMQFIIQNKEKINNIFRDAF